jgi:hypothetical protein
MNWFPKKHQGSKAALHILHLSRIRKSYTVPRSDTTTSL